jgi:hypothetical protein
VDGLSKEGEIAALERAAAGTPGALYFGHLLYADDTANHHSPRRDLVPRSHPTLVQRSSSPSPAVSRRRHRMINIPRAAHPHEG